MSSRDDSPFSFFVPLMFVLICFMLTFVLCCPLFYVGFCFVSTFLCWLLFLSIFFALTFVLCQLFSHGPLFCVNFCFVLTFSCWLLLTCKTKEVAAWLWTLSRLHVFSGPRDVKITSHHRNPPLCDFFSGVHKNSKCFPITRENSTPLRKSTPLWHLS